MAQEGDPARSYICRLIILKVLVFAFSPAVKNGRVRAAIIAWASRSRPRVKECRRGRSQARAARTLSVSLASLAGSG